MISIKCCVIVLMVLTLTLYVKLYDISQWKYKLSTNTLVPRADTKYGNANITPNLDDHDVRVLCWIMTAPEFLDSRAVHVRNTWGRKCNVLLFASDYKNDTFGTIDITVPHGRSYLPTKTFQTFQYIYNRHMDDADWFFKADDDTYTYMDNLRIFLRQYDTNKPFYFGYQWKKYVKQGYPSGGAGYILSKEAMNRLGTRGRNCSCTNGNEDVKMGICMENLGVKPISRIEFHPYELAHYSNHVPANTITLHYVKPNEMYDLQAKGTPP